ncbi:MAG: hypothetical protein JWM21_876 [Acidobacteria bacterium]|nr:hypothetical protein [Acidobacteriota bacterium]
MRGLQGKRARNSNLDCRRFAVACKKLLSIRAKESISNMLIKLRSVRQVMVETTGQPGTAKREMHLALPAVRGATCPVVVNGRVELASHIVPSWVW